MDHDHPAPGYTLIRDLPASERPRERLRDFGAQALSTQELIAILLRTGTSKESALAQASRLLARFEGLPGLARSSFNELRNEKGLGEAKAAQIKAAIELGMRAASAMPEERRIFKSPDDLANIALAEMSLLEQEVVRVLLLDARLRMIGFPEVYRGSVHTAQVRISELLRDAVRVNATSIVLVHNHPSGDPTPSASDIQMTKMLFDSARVMDIALLDHMIIAGGRYVSMKGVNMGFPHGS
ncbi:MAG: RadC family protein [Dehalococcoidia bacterium]